MAGGPAFFLDGKPAPPLAYMSYLPREGDYRSIASTGIHLYCVPAYLGDRGINPRSGIGPFRPPIWTGEGTFDFRSLQEDLDKVLRADPEARILVRLHLDAPAWWEKRHPEHACRLPDGGSFRQSFFSDFWREDTARALRACLRWMLDGAYARRIAGIHVAAGGTEEWFYHFRDAFQDGNPQRVAAFRRWLRAAYGGDVAALRAAWNDPDAGFETAAPADISGAAPEPPKEGLPPSGQARWRDPVRERPVLDTFRFHSEHMADRIASFCRVVKEESRGRLLAGAFYGYHFFVADPRAGHHALGRLLRCRDLDYLSSPNAYDRSLGADWPPMAAWNSVRLHGKLWLAENDTRTSKTTLLKDVAPGICPPGAYAQGVWRGPGNLDDSVALLRKDAARMLAEGYGGWWFDMWGGWYDDPRMREVFRRTRRLMDEAVRTQPPAMPVQVCVAMDEELCFSDASFGAQTGAVLAVRSALARAGAPYDLYLQGDLDRVMPGAYRVLWLVGPATLDPALAERIERWRARGITVVWNPPAGARAWTPAELRTVWKNAGVHVWLDEDDVLYAKRGWLMIHTLTGGRREVRLPFAARVDDVFEDRLVADGADRIVLDLPPRSTTLLRLRPVGRGR